MLLFHALWNCVRKSKVHGDRLEDTIYNPLTILDQESKGHNLDLSWT